mmetsp:Transcript_16224/g.24604  ORF Transcript_16224/g.24604 Transcript_16224/m.24604 type:complete len:519 (+) Transcript_16224:83-1639(+)
MNNNRTILDFLKAANNGGQPVYDPINSPRSLEACLRSGFDPEELLPMTMADFKASHRHLPEEIQKMKYEHLEKRRVEKLEVVVRERENVIKYMEARKEDSNSPRSGNSVNTMNLVEKRAKQIQQKTGDLERQRLEAIKRRQAKELARMVQTEQELAALHKKIARGEEEERRRGEEHEKKVQAARAAEMERRRQRDLEKKAEEREELRKRRALAAREEAAEKKQKEREDQERARLGREAREREEQLRVKRLEHLRQKAEEERAQEEVAEANRLRLLERSAAVKRAMDDKKARQHEEMMEKRRRAEERIQGTLENNKRLQEKKKEEFLKRTREAAERAAEKEQELRAQLTQSEKEREKKEADRQKRLAEARRGRAERARDLVAKARDKDLQMEKTREAKDREHMVARVMKELKDEEQRQNVERIKRVDEFVRLQMLQAIRLQDERTDKLRRERELLVEKRKEISHKMLLNKHRVMEAMEQMKVTNKFVAIDLDHDGKGKKKKKRDGDDDDMDATVGGQPF